MKLGVSINLFNGEELLESCLEYIRPYADVLNIIYQNVSNFGTHPKDLKPLIDRMNKKKLIDNHIFYTPTKNFEGLDEGTKELIKNEGNIFHDTTYDESIYYGIFNEMNKRNLSLHYLRSQGCTHLLDMDTDEFYIKEQIEEAIKYVEKGNYDASFCQMQTYYRFNNVIITPPETYYVPFIYQIKTSSKFEQIENTDFPVFCDGKRRIKCGYPLVFDRSELEMHHYSYVRNNVESMKSKFKNCSSKMNFDDDKVNLLCKNWENFKRGDMALFNSGGSGVRYYETKVITPFFNIKL